MKAGVTSDGGKNFSLNVIPTEAEAGFDIRIPPTVDLDEFKKQIDKWTSDENVSYVFTTNPTMKHHVSSTKSDSFWFSTFKSCTDKL